MSSNTTTRFPHVQSQQLAACHPRCLGRYVQVTRANGEGPVLLVLPDSPSRSGAITNNLGKGETQGAGGGFEAWRPLSGGEERGNKDWMQ